MCEASPVFRTKLCFVNVAVAEYSVLFGAHAGCSVFLKCMYSVLFYLWAFFVYRCVSSSRKEKTYFAENIPENQDNYPQLSLLNVEMFFSYRASRISSSMNSSLP